MSNRIDTLSLGWPLVGVVQSIRVIVPEPQGKGAGRAVAEVIGVHKRVASIGI